MTDINLLITEYIRYAESIGQSWYTVRNARSGLKRFTRFLHTLGIHRLEDVHREILESYQQELCFDTGNHGRRLSVRTQMQLLGVVKGFTRFLKNGTILLPTLAMQSGCRKSPNNCLGLF